MNTYDIGDRPKLTFTFTDEDGAPADPTTVTCKIRKDGEAVTTYVYGTDAEVVKDAVGVYHVDYLLTSSGIYYYRGEGTGAIVAAGERNLRVLTSKF